MDQAGAARADAPPLAAATGSGCVVCGLDQDANQILLCDGCDAEYHIYCLVPPLQEIPEGDFYCKSCKDAKRHLTKSSSSASASAAAAAGGGGAGGGPTQAGFAVQDENGRMVPIRSEDVRESKYRGVLKLLSKGAKKPFVARVHKDDKFVQLGLFSSEIEAAHAYDKAAIQMFGRVAMLNFPHLHDGFVRAAGAAATASASTTAATSTAARPSAAVSTAAASPAFGTPGRGRGRGRGRGGGGRGSRGGASVGGGGRGKRRLEDSPMRDVAAASASGGGAEASSTSTSSAKKRKALAVVTAGDDTPITNGPKYLGVQVFRGYAHAQILVNAKTVNLGTFPTAVDAAMAYDKAALKYYGGEMGSKDALHDRVVLNFPGKRAELLKQLIEESMHQKARQASGSLVAAGGGAASSANRSMQSAKHNLSIKKLENWVVKLQRSVKLVEAAHRVQWDGLPLVKPEEPPQAEQQDEDAEATQPHQDVKLELLAGAGPTIKTEFTKKQQRLRASATHIQDAVNLMIQELKIYADDTPVDAAFIPPPRSHALLDLMSTSRFLKLCSTINELAHFNVTATGADAGKPLGPDEVSIEESFETLVQTVVDYRTRLQMAASAEKQKLAGLVESDGNATASPSGAEGEAGQANGATSDADILSREMLGRAKYVKRKVQRVLKVKKVVSAIEAAPVAAVGADEEQKEEETATSVKTTEPDAKEEKAGEDEKLPEDEKPQEEEKSQEEEKPQQEEKPEVAEKLQEEEKSEVAAPETEQMEVDASGDASVESEEKKEESTESTAGASVDKEAKVESVAEAVSEASVDTLSEKEKPASDEPAMASEAEPSAPAEDAAAEKPAADVTSEDVKMEEPAAAEEPTESAPSLEESIPAVAEDVEKPSDAKKSEQAPANSEETPATEKPSDGDEVMEDAAAVAETPAPAEADEAIAPVDTNTDSTPVAVEASVVTPEPAHEEEEETIIEESWEYCLALKPLASSTRAAADKDDLWRLLPLESESGEFIDDVFLTDDEVAEIEVTEAVVCGGKAAGEDSDLPSRKEQLPKLHQREIALRERVKAENDRRLALEGVIKIEQERLSQVFVVYRRMLEGIMVKSSDVQKKHQRITRDLLLVELMKQSFAPIMDDLLQQCESVFLQRLMKLSDRFEDFQQEFDYYTDALLSVVGTSTEGGSQQNGHMKDEATTPAAENGVATNPAAEDDDEESSGLRGAYVSFYMEEIETLWKERCRAVESLYAIMRSLTAGAPEQVPSEEGEGAVVPVDSANGTPVLRRRVHENLEQWKSVQWPTQLATPPFVASFMKDSSSRGAGAAVLLPSASVKDQDAVTSAMSELKQIIIDLTQETPTTVTSRVVHQSTLVVYHPVFLEHQTPKDHPECPERLNRIITMLNTLRKKFDDSLKIDRLTQTPEELSPSESILLAVHSPAYLQQLKDRSVEARSNTESGSRSSVSLAASALVFETNHGAVDLSATSLSATRASPTGSMGGAFGAANMMPTGIAMDTYVSSKSWDVARAAAGTVCLAVDRVIRKEFRNAACLVRPPGHHVGRHGRTLDAPSSGFCLLNNVVIGAVHARQYPWIRRVAVLDWDIHHGNGTEELMRDDPDGFFASVHLYASGKFFPGTGKSEQQANLVNVALENTGAGSGSAAFRSALQEQILPAMRAFQPDIIFISAGFDGHKDDILGGRAAVKNTAVPAGYLEDDYVWATTEVLKLADECCDGRVVSVLEGGYDVRKETNSLAKSVAAHVSAIASYEQEKRQLQQTADVEADEQSTLVMKSDESVDSKRLLLSLLAKNIDDDDVVIIDDDEDDDDDAADKSGLLSAEDVDVDEDLDDGDDDVDSDGVEVEEDDDETHGDGDHHSHDVDEDVVMTDEDHEDHSVDGDDGDAHSTGLSFAASLSVDGEDDDDQRSQEDLHEGDIDMDGLPRNPQDSRIDTPEYDHLDGHGTGEEEGDDDMVGGHGDEDDGDLLGDEDNDSVGELPSLS